MDNFMTVEHRFDASDIIKANGQAEAVDLQNTKEQLVNIESQMEKVDGALTDLRQINLKNIETAEEIQNFTRESEGKINEATEKLNSTLKETSEASIAGINRTVDESLAKIASIKEGADDSEAINEGFKGLTENLEKLLKQLEEYMHTDHVKIYRNVQAALTDEINKQTEDLKSSLMKKSSTTPLVIINIMLTVILIMFLLANYFGFI